MFFAHFVLQVVIFIIAFVVMWIASNKVIDFGVETAKVFNVSKLFIGFIFIGLSTALPELAVALTSAFDGIPEIAAGNIIGANFNNISLVLGLTAFLGGGLCVGKKDKKNLLILLLIISFLFLFVFWAGQLSFLHGIVLILSYFFTLLWMWKSKTVVEDENKDVDQRPSYTYHDKLITIFKFILSVFVVLLASEFAVGRSEIISNMLHLSIETFGATIFSIVTTVPELVLSINAVRKKEHSIALGTLIGSVLPHLCLCLGFLTFFSNKIISIVPLQSFAIFIFAALFIISLSLWVHNKISKFAGLALFVLFVVSFVYHLFF